MSIAGLYAAELRSRFAAAGEFSALVDGSRVACESLSVRAMNFGQHWRAAGVPVSRYSLALPLSFFVAFLEEPMALPDLNHDAKLRPDASDPLDQALIAASFPSAEEAVRAPALCHRLAVFFAPDVLVRWLGDGGPKVSPGFVVNSCDQIRFEASDMWLGGECRPSGASSAYQDL